MTEGWNEAVARLGLSERETARKAALFDEAHAGLKDLLGANSLGNEMSSVVAHWVPGRVEFLGKHTDYAGGRSLLCTVERGVCMVAQPRSDERGSADYKRSVVRVFTERGLRKDAETAGS